MLLNAKLPVLNWFPVTISRAEMAYLQRFQDFIKYEAGESLIMNNLSAPTLQTCTFVTCACTGSDWSTDYATDTLKVSAFAQVSVIKPLQA